MLSSNQNSKWKAREISERIGGRNRARYAGVNQWCVHILDVIGFCSTASQKGNGGMGEVIEMGKEKGHKFQEVTPQRGNFRWEKGKLGRDKLEAQKMMTGSEKGTNDIIGDNFRTRKRRGFLLQGVKFLDSKSFVC